MLDKVAKAASEAEETAEAHAMRVSRGQEDVVVATFRAAEREEREGSERAKITETNREPVSSGFNERLTESEMSLKTSGDDDDCDDEGNDDDEDEDAAAIAADIASSETAFSNKCATSFTKAEPSLPPLPNPLPPLPHILNPHKRLRERRDALVPNTMIARLCEQASERHQLLEDAKNSPKGIRGVDQEELDLCGLSSQMENAGASDNKDKDGEDDDEAVDEGGDVHKAKRIKFEI